MVANLLDKCTSQDLANIAWAYSLANVAAPTIFNNGFIDVCLKKDGRYLGLEVACQLYQWQLWQEELKSGINLPPSLREKCHKSLSVRAPRPSDLQDDVIAQLLSIGVKLEEEVLTKSGYRLDAVIEVDGREIGIEVDGPSHFVGRKPTGSTILKHRQVTNLDGIQVVSVPYWEWNKLGQDSEKKQQYLRSLLDLT